MNHVFISRFKASLFSTLFLLSFFAVKPALSEGLSGSAAVRLHINDVNNADDDRIEVTETFVRSGIGLSYSFAKGFSIEAAASLEGNPIAGDECGDPDDLADLCGNQNYDADHAIAMDDLVLHFEYGPARLYAGRFTAAVGQDPGDFPGILTYLTIEEYEIADRLGLGLTYTMESERFGSHEVNLGAFYADTSFLADTLITSGGHNSRDDGGLGNTESLDSYSLALSGGDLPSLSGLSYQIAYAHQAEGWADKRNEENPRSADESRHYMSLAYGHEFNDDWSARLITEYVAIDDFDGSDDYDREYTTLGLGLDYVMVNEDAHLVR